MRREIIVCDVCGDDIFERPDRAPAPRLADKCVTLEVRTNAKRAVFRDEAERSGEMAEILHVCFTCANDSLGGWGPFDGFSVAPPGEPSTEGAEEPPASAEPKLKNIERFLNVVVQTEDGKRELVCSPGTSAKNTSNTLAPMVEWPVGSVVRADIEGKHLTVRVVGYAVKTKDQLSWDAVTPECAGCQSHTKHGERVSIREAGDKAYEALCGACTKALQEAS